MRKTGALHIILELVTIFSCIVIGITILTFNYQGVEASKSYVGSIILAIGTTELVEFVAMKDLVKLRNIPMAIISALEIVLGFLVLFLDIELATVCLVWGICSIAFQVGKVVNAGLNLIRQPFLNMFVIILCIIETIFSVFLIVRTTSALNPHFIYLGINMLILSVILIVEFLIHRYQKQSF